MVFYLHFGGFLNLRLGNFSHAFSKCFSAIRGLLWGYLMLNLDAVEKKCSGLSVDADCHLVTSVWETQIRFCIDRKRLTLGLFIQVVKQRVKTIAKLCNTPYVLCQK